MARTYTPLPFAGPAVIAGVVLLAGGPIALGGLVLFAGHVVGPAVGTVLGRLAAAVDDNLAELDPNEGDT